MKVVFAHLSDVGRVRSGNEDSARCISDPAGERGHLLVVADGMGGAAAGDVASRIAVEAVEEIYLASSEPPLDALARAVVVANERIVIASEEQADAAGMGTTCTALCVLGDKAYLAHVGDSRAYLLRGRTITRLTRDQSVWADRVRNGAAPSSEYGRNQLTEAVGLDPTLEPYTRGDLEVRAGDRFLLCSDGLWGLVTDPEILAIARQGALDEICASLVDLANRRGGPDNITVVVAEAGD